MPTVLCLGDQFTVGQEALADGYRSYRGTLQTQLATAGITSLDFVGPNSDRPASGGTDGDHAGYANARIDSTGSSTNNLTDRLSALKTAFPAVDLVVLYVGWGDVINTPASIGARYTSLLSAIQSGAWATTKVVCCTLHPSPGQTEAQTGGVYAAYATLNATIRALCAAAPTTRILADLAALTGADQAAFVERIIYRAQTRPPVTTALGGATLPNWAGGHRVTSFKSIQDYNATWSRTAPASGTGNNGGTAGLNPALESVVGGTNLFVANVQSVIPWVWAFCQPGHASTNTCIELRNLFAQARHATQGWRFFFQGARLGLPGNTSSAGSPFGSPRSGQRADGITTWICPDGSRGIEVWADDTVPSRGVVPFYGGRDRELMSNAQGFVVGVQARLALIDPNGPDDRAAARFGITVGEDFSREYASDADRYDRYGWPYTVMDGGSDMWEPLTSTEWTAITSATIGRGGAGSTGANSHWEDPATPPPLSPYASATPYNDIPTYSLSTDDLRATPPPVPVYWEATGGTGSGYATVDYYLVASTGQRSLELYQSGADKIARVISRAIITSGALAGGRLSGLLPGLPVKPNVFLRLNGSSQANVEPKDWDTTSAPVWRPTILPIAVIGSAYSAQLSASGSPAPTYSIVSGAPAWLACSSAGVLSGTPTGTDETRAVTFRATNSAGTADLLVTLQVSTAMQITTSSLPSAELGSTYVQQLVAAGSAPFTWSIISGSLPAGIALSASGILSGTPTATGTASFTVQAIGAGGQSATRALTLTVGASGNVPVITSSTLADATVGTAYSATVGATGATPRTWSIIAGSLPPGLSLAGSTGVISGTPTVAGGYPVTLQLVNAFGVTTAQLSIRVAAAGAAAPVSPWTKWLKGR